MSTGTQLPDAAPDPEVTIRLRLSEVHVVYKHLVKAPYDEVAILIRKVAGQVEGQKAPRAVPMPAMPETSVRN